MNKKKRFILSSLGALSMLNAGASGLEGNRQFYNMPQNVTQNVLKIPQPSNFGMQQVNPGLNQKVLNSNSMQQQQQKSDIKGRVISGVGGGFVGFWAGIGIKHALSKKNIEELNLQITDLEIKLKNAQQNVQSKDSQIDSLNSDKSKLNDSIEKLKELNKKFEQENSDLKSKIQTFENSDDKNKKITELQDEVQDLKNKYNDMEAKSEKYKKALLSTSDLLLRLGEHSYLILKDLYSDFQENDKVKFESVADLALLNYFVRQAKKQTLIACNRKDDDGITFRARDRNKILMKSEYTTNGFRDFVDEYSWYLNGINGNKKHSGKLHDSVKNSEDLKTVAEELIKEQLTIK